MDQTTQDVLCTLCRQIISSQHPFCPYCGSRNVMYPSLPQQRYAETQAMQDWYRHLPPNISPELFLQLSHVQSPRQWPPQWVHQGTSQFQPQPQVGHQQLPGHAGSQFQAQPQMGHQQWAGHTSSMFQPQPLAGHQQQQSSAIQSAPQDSRSITGLPSEKDRTKEKVNMFEKEVDELKHNLSQVSGKDGDPVQEPDSGNNPGLLMKQNENDDKSETKGSGGVCLTGHETDAARQSAVTDCHRSYSAEEGDKVTDLNCNLKPSTVKTDHLQKTSNATSMAPLVDNASELEGSRQARESQTVFGMKPPDIPGKLVDGQDRSSKGYLPSDTGGVADRARDRVSAGPAVSGKTLGRDPRSECQKTVEEQHGTRESECSDKTTHIGEQMNINTTDHGRGDSAAVDGMKEQISGEQQSDLTRDRSACAEGDKELSGNSLSARDEMTIAHRSQKGGPLSPEEGQCDVSVVSDDKEKAKSPGDDQPSRGSNEVDQGSSPEQEERTRAPNGTDGSKRVADASGGTDPTSSCLGMDGGLTGKEGEAYRKKKKVPTATLR